MLAPLPTINAPTGSEVHAHAAAQAHRRDRWKMPAAASPEQELPVLIIGGSLVGLSAALFLRWHGVDVLGVERHAGTAIRPRSGHLQLRTLELLRSVGLEDVVRRKG